MFKIIVFFSILIAFVNGGCPSISSIYVPGRVNCPLCDFITSSQAISGSGNQYSIICPSSTEVWYYNEKGNEFVTPMTKVGTKGVIKCDGSKWKISVPGQSQTLSAFACGRS
uniref:C6 domain-containing protein n=1 Tax=Caenorhabditis tropicalis TaxID=1561998 RepID=A0A1I7TKF4_9PELO